MALVLTLAALTLALGLAPAVWLWRVRGASTLDWLFAAAITGGVVVFAYGNAPWLFVSHYLRYVALGGFGVVAFASLWWRRRLSLSAPKLLGRRGLVLRVVALLGVIALDVVALVGGLRPEGTVDVTFPLSHGTYGVLQGGASIITNPFHHANRAERLAIDLVKLNSYGARAAGVAPRALTAYAIFGDSVVSPCDGTVVAAVDGVADNPPGRANVAVPAGNHVILHCEGTDLLLAHLKQGSVTVQPAQRVVHGQPLGRVGNSGNTSEPHLHISASRGGCGVPLSFDGRFLSLNSLYTPFGR